MRNKPIAFLWYVSVALIVGVCVLQIWILSNPEPIPQRDRHSQVVTLLLGSSALVMIFVAEGINRTLKRNAYTDVTGIMNKTACMEQMGILDCRDSTLNIGLAMFDLNNLKQVNDFYGHEAGDRLIQQFVSLLRQSAERRYFLGRFGGDEFIAIIQNCEESVMRSFLERLVRAVEKSNAANQVRISYACGFAISTRAHYYLIDELLKEADQNMYENKKSMKAGRMEKPKQSAEEAEGEAAAEADDSAAGPVSHDAFVAAVGRVLKARGGGSRLALVCSDVHNFRYFNELYGHKEGDRILRQFSMELGRQSFCLCSYRLYSDNFASLIDVSRLSEEQAVAMLRDWSVGFAAIVDKAYRGSRLIVKSGIYFISDLHEPVETMLYNADCARKFSKPAFDNIVVYSDALRQTVKQRFEIINSFQRALDRREFQVYVQPKISCRDKTICSAEALVRWRRSDGSFLSPEAFVSVLEQSGDIVNMDFYVYEKVFEYLYTQQLKRSANIPISVNMSRVHLTMTENFIERLGRLRSRYPIPSSLVTFELTESAYIQEIDSAEQLIHQLRALGYRISMDDFGSGYSSLKALHPMHFDEVKFDQAFLHREITEEAGNWLIRLINLVKSLDITIVCEGVETEENIALLERSRCDLLQGYYYYKPFPLEELGTLAAQYRPQLLDMPRENREDSRCIG